MKNEVKNCKTKNTFLQFQQIQKDSDPDQRACSQSPCQIWPDFPSILTTAVISNPEDLWNLSSCLLCLWLLRQHLDLNDSTDSHRDRIHFWTLPLRMVWHRRVENYLQAQSAPVLSEYYKMFWQMSGREEQWVERMDVSSFVTGLYHITNFCWLYSNHPQIYQCHKLCLKFVCLSMRILLWDWCFSSRLKPAYTVCHMQIIG